MILRNGTSLWITRAVLMDTRGELLKEYGIRSYPSALFVGSDGSLAKTHIGYMSKEDIEKTLKEIK